jgi:hypothetical protein
MNTTPLFPGMASLVQPFKFPASPYEYKVTPLRECPTPESLQQCDTPDKAADYALVTSVNLCNLIGYASAPPELFIAYGAIVRQMQPHTRGLAYHAIACELDWPHRDMIWDLARLADEDKPKCKCAFER